MLAEVKKTKSFWKWLYLDLRYGREKANEYLD